MGRLDTSRRRRISHGARRLPAEVTMDRPQYEPLAQIEAPPGTASVLRSPVADALVKAIRAAAGVGEFAMDDAEELVRYAVRRGLIGPEEGDRVLADIEVPLKPKVKPVRAARPKPLVKKKAAKKKSRR